MDENRDIVAAPWIGSLAYPHEDEVATLIREGWFETAEQAFWWLYLRPGDQVVDCGAHAGLFSCLAMEATKGSGTVIAVDPNPAILTYLEDNLSRRRGEVHIARFAVGSGNGAQKLHTERSGRSAYASLYASPDESGEFEVATLTLDELLVRYGQTRVDLLKLDVEGAEIDALAGLTETLNRHAVRCIMIEFTELNLQRSGRTTADLVDAVRSTGLTLCEFDTQTLQLRAFAREGIIWYDNLFAVADIDEVNARLAGAEPEARAAALDLVRRGKAAGATKAAVGVAERRLDLLRRTTTEISVLSQRVQYCTSSWPLRLALKLRLVARPSWLTHVDQSHANLSNLLEQVEREAYQGPKRQKDEPSAGPKVAVVICTFNPNPELLRRALTSIAEQTVSREGCEYVIVDNNSSPPLSLEAFPEFTNMPLRIVREPRQGLIFARLRGIVETTAPLIVFVDDDNALGPSYLSAALQIAAAHPEIGLFGGIARAKLDFEPPSWKRYFLPYLGIKDCGTSPITSFEPFWGEWEPIGAGMVARRDVANAYKEFVETSPDAGGLGRSGAALLSAEDALFARIANRLGYACSYQPSLALDHAIPRRRLETRYLFRLLEGMGRSHVRLERVLRHLHGPAPLTRYRLLKRLAYRVFKQGFAGVIRWAWDLGYFRESLEAQKTLTVKDGTTGA